MVKTCSCVTGPIKQNRKIVVLRVSENCLVMIICLFVELHHRISEMCLLTTSFLQCSLYCKFCIVNEILEINFMLLTIHLF